jgi:hypothetical protein
MQKEIGVLLVLGALALLLVGVVMLYLRGRRIRIQKEAARRHQNREDARIADAEELQQQQYLEVRRVARERARVAYPDLLEKNEANGESCNEEFVPGPGDLELIREAQGLLDAEIVELSKDPAARLGSGETKAKFQTLKYESQVLASVQSDPPSYRRPALYLEVPARIIDCGEAGKVELFTSTQVEAARERSGYSDFVRFLEERNEAPKLATEIIERLRLGSEAAEQEKRNAEAAITTRLEDLPPLPRTK